MTNELKQLLLDVADNTIEKMWDHPNHVLMNQFGIELLSNFLIRGLWVVHRKKT
jgi:hypothetical protein